MRFSFKENMRQVLTYGTINLSSISMETLSKNHTCPNQHQMRLAECTFGIPHDLSGFALLLPDLRNNDT